MSSNPLRQLVLVPLALLAFALSACAPLDEILDTPTITESDPVPTISQSEDYVVSLGDAEIDYEATAGEIDYCDLDELGRTVCAYGKLTSTMREQAQAREKLDINVDPSGWPEHNDEVEIPALDEVEGSRDYHGWMMNRSHLIADSLGGSVDVENLVTGTRMQNVGSRQVDGQYAGGMAYTELMARSYLDNNDGDTCPLYYAATPVYSGDELVPRTVIVDIQSCDKSIDERVEVSNTANGWEINYFDGSYAPVSAD